MDRPGLTAFVEICAAGFDVDRPAFLGRDDVRAVGIARRNDAAAATDFVVHRRKPKAAGCADEPSEGRTGEKAGIFRM